MITGESGGRWKWVNGNVVSSRAIPQGRLCRNATHGLVRTILATLPLGLAVGNMLV